MTVQARDPRNGAIFTGMPVAKCQRSASAGLQIAQGKAIGTAG
jgi:hypothetical protein